MSSARRLGCTGRDKPANFHFYSLGPSFSGHDVTAILRRCDAPYPGEAIRANYVSYIYGSCELPTDPVGDHIEGGCAPPLEIQVWPACERTRADYTFDGHPYPREDLGARRGVPAARFDEGERLELYAGKSTIVIFGNEPSEVSSAVAAVRAEPKDRPPGPPSSGPPSGDLPEPAAGATAGELSCSA